MDEATKIVSDWVLGLFGEQRVVKRRRRRAANPT